LTADLKLSLFVIRTNKAKKRKFNAYAKICAEYTHNRIPVNYFISRSVLSAFELNLGLQLMAIRASDLSREQAEKVWQRKRASTRPQQFRSGPSKM
jgi:hypothetical protein